MDPTTAGTPAGFAVTWSDYNSNTSTGYNIYAQIFKAGGAAVEQRVHG